MIKIFNLFLIIIFCFSCSLNKNSKFWTKEKIKEIEEKKFEKIFDNPKALSQELNTNINLNFSTNPKKSKLSKKLTNNDGRVNFDGSLKKLSKYKFSKIENFYQAEPVVSFYGENVIFFDDKGTILQFDKKSKLIWKKNYYTKSESVWKSHALYLMAEYFYSKNEMQKSKEFFNQIVNLENANNEIKLESQKRLKRDLSD